MPTARQSRVVNAPLEEVWAIVGDPHHLPRWWPRVERIEQATAGAFTEVMRSNRGRVVRADQRLAELEEGSTIAWEQSVEGTPFERLVKQVRTTVRVAPEGAGTRVELERLQRMRGMARFGSFMARRATRGLLAEALASLAAIAEPGASTPSPA